MGSRANYIFIFIIFTLSVLIRLPNIDRPLSSNYEWVTAHTLVTLNIWKQEGIINHKLNPIYTFPNANDHYIKCPISGVSNEQGDYYYVSYPPFAFIFPYIFFKLSGVNISALSLQIFNLSIHLLCSILLFIIISNITETKKQLNSPALLGAAIYIFSPINLWNHSNVYFADILVQLFFLLSLLFFQLILTKTKPNYSYNIFFWASLFFMIYTEWLGLLLAGCLFLYFIFNRKFKTAIGISLISIFAISIVMIQYASIAGHEAYLNTLLNRYSERSGQFGPAQIYQSDSLLFLLTMYLRNFFPYLIILVFTLAITYLIGKKLKPNISQVGKATLFLSFSPVILHHILLFEFTIVHELSLVKASVFIAILIGLFSAPIFSTIANKKYIYENSLYLFVISTMFILGVYFYYSHIIVPDEYASKRLGNQIRNTSSEVDTIFFKSSQTYGDFLIQAPENFVIAPQIQYYAGRCIQVVQNTTEAIQHLKSYNKKQGVIYTIENPFYKIEAIERVQSPKVLNTLEDTR